MTIASYIDTSHAEDVCTAPAIGASLSDYLTNLLDDAEAEFFEIHLADCNHCKTRYLTVLRVRHEGQRQQAAELMNGQDFNATPRLVEAEEVPRKDALVAKRAAVAKSNGN